MRVAVIGAGIVGACIARSLAMTGVEVVVLDRGQVGSGTTSRGEGNILVSDKAPGPELDLALASRALWAELADDLGAAMLEFEPKGGLVVATSARGLDVLSGFSRAQREVGVRVSAVSPEEAVDLEPWLATDLPGGAFYDQDAQVQPVMAAAAILADAVRRGATFRAGAEVAGVRTGGRGQVVGIITASGDRVDVDAVVKDTGTWGGVVGERLGAPIPVLPRRGFLLVTEPMPRRVEHKVYSADYVDNVAASTEGLETSCVVEGTQGGTILIGASRERVGFDQTMNPGIVRALAEQAVRIFPDPATGMRAHRVEIAQQDHLPARIGRCQITQDLLAHQLRPPIRVGRRSGEALIDRHPRGLPIDRCGRAEHHPPASGHLHRP